MKRAAGVVLAVMLIGCGVETKTQGPTSSEPPAIPTDGRPMATVGFNRALAAGVTNVKVVLKTTAPAQVPVMVFDPEGNSYVSVPCTSGGIECSTYTGASCAAGSCVTTVTKTAIFYVKNDTNPPATGYAFPVPCDGKTYAAEIYTAIASGSTLQLQDLVQAPSVVVSTDCATVATPPVWSSVPPPSLSIPTVYAGLPAPNDRYTVGVSGDAYPFASSFTLTAQQGTNPAVAGTFFGGTAVLAAPTTAGAITLTATFQLDNSILSASDAKTPWQWHVNASATPVGALPVGGP